MNLNQALLEIIAQNAADERRELNERHHARLSAYHLRLAGTPIPSVTFADVEVVFSV